MSVAIAIRFLAGRYHATSWERHPNEGVPEWPPAPWRLLRAVVAAAHRADAPPDLDRLRRIAGALSEAPSYWTPPAVQAHLRSYQPLGQLGKTTLVLDPFVAMGRGAGDPGAEVVIGWENAHLAPDDRAALARWLDVLGYLGRAESWVEARLVEYPPVEPTAVAWDESWTGASELVRVLAPGTDDPAALLDAFCIDTATLHAARRLQPPHSTWVDFAWRTPPYAEPPHVPRGGSRASSTPTLVRFALGGRVLPLVTDTVRFGDRVRAALMARSRDAFGRPHPVFSGKAPNGAPLQGNAHVHVMPSDDDRDGRIDHVLLWAPGGFDAQALGAINGFSWLWGDDGYDLRVALTGTGTSEAVDALGVPRHLQRRSVVQATRVWRSVTPFVLPRHPKVRRGLVVDGVEQQLLRELQRLGLPVPQQVRSVRGTVGKVPLPWSRFRTRRTDGGGSRGGDRGYGFQLEFAEPVRGPIAIGYGARQGLGQFAPVPDDEAGSR